MNAAQEAELDVLAGIPSDKARHEVEALRGQVKQLGAMVVELLACADPHRDRAEIRRARRMLREIGL